MTNSPGELTLDHFLAFKMKLEERMVPNYDHLMVFPSVEARDAFCSDFLKTEVGNYLTTHRMKVQPDQDIQICGITLRVLPTIPKRWTDTDGN